MKSPDLVSLVQIIVQRDVNRFVIFELHFCLVLVVKKLVNYNPFLL